MDDPQFDYAILPTGLDKVGHELFDLGGLESMQIQNAIDRQVDRVVVWFDHEMNISAVNLKEIKNPRIIDPGDVVESPVGVIVLLLFRSSSL